MYCKNLNEGKFLPCIEKLEMSHNKFFLSCLTKNLLIMKMFFSLAAVIAISMLLALTSCTSSKKMALSCPEPVDSYRSKVVTKHHLKTPNLFAQTKKTSQWDYSKKRNIANAKLNKTTKSLKNVGVIEKNANTSGEIRTNATEFPDNLYAAIDKNNETGISSLVFSINDFFPDFEISVPTYRKTETIPLESAVSSEISFNNYTDPLFQPSLSIPLNNQEQTGSEKKTDGLGIAGFVVSLAGLLILPIPCGIVGIVLSAISLGKINRNPDKLKGQGLAIAGLAVGAVVLVLGIIILAAVL